ncbi:uncharacterized protein PpBr36_09176 [Pyricularia pennisetigena]|uniref:uncharacterized protein n=1 Tax=Pyricularia pennisetigena TaxID=1578925 RepID=UPI00114DE52A|nr:uncharacterized protein PpBr36_09176 [Pyricularia pennisetigena]TLS22033.1 hypothetical protein PpBr36_09176 [Pyricularia pennisetigena]
MSCGERLRGGRNQPPTRVVSGQILSGIFLKREILHRRVEKELELPNKEMQGCVWARKKKGGFRSLPNTPLDDQISALEAAGSGLLHACPESLPV